MSNKRKPSDAVGETPPDSTTPLAPSAAGPLGQLLTHMVEQAPHKYSIVDGAPDTRTPLNVWPSEPPETDYFQKTWARLGTGVQLKQSQHQIPDNAGPLNSNQLIHRALLLMQEQSSGYLQHFLHYSDTLSWMEQLNAAATAPTKAATRAGPKKAVRKAR